MRFALTDCVLLRTTSPRSQLMPRHFVVKRNPDLSGLKGKRPIKGWQWYVQKSVNGVPHGARAINAGDIIYLYEKGYAVYAAVRW